MKPDHADARASEVRNGAARPRTPRRGAADPSVTEQGAERLPELEFAVEGAGVREYAAVPTLRFDLRIDPGEAVIRSLSLNVLVRIVATQRSYDAAEQGRLFELFGAPRDWGRNLRTLMWAQTSFVVPAFEGVERADLCVPASYDFEVAGNKYMHALGDGEVPLEFLFSGSVFYRGPGGSLRTVRLSWDKECRYDMPVSVWRETMEHYFPNSAWLRVRRDVFDRLQAFRSSQGLPTWEATLEALLPERPAREEQT